jgi:hypothetical protein
MLVNYAHAAHWPVDPARLDLVEEFRRKPKGPHSPDLQKLLHRMRWAGDPETGGRYVLLVQDPGRRWMLARLPAVRGAPIMPIANQVFTSLAAAEWDVFKRRWHALTGQTLSGSIEGVEA